MLTQMTMMLTTDNSWFFSHFDEVFHKTRKCRKWWHMLLSYEAFNFIKYEHKFECLLRITEIKNWFLKTSFRSFALSNMAVYISGSTNITGKCFAQAHGSLSILRWYFCRQNSFSTCLDISSSQETFICFWWEINQKVPTVTSRAKNTQWWKRKKL